MTFALILVIVGLLVVILVLVVKLERAKTWRFKGAPFVFSPLNQSTGPLSTVAAPDNPATPRAFADADEYRKLAGIPGSAQPTQTASGAQLTALRQNLRVKLLHQEDKIDDAIESERRRNPNRSEAELMKAAIERWERDNQ